MSTDIPRVLILTVRMLAVFASDIVEHRRKHLGEPDITRVSEQE